MEYFIKNEYLTVKTVSKGGEIRSVVDWNKKNRLHDGNPLYWKGVSPILFPQISKTPNFMYRVQNKEYYMPQHGFLRDSELTVEEKKDDKIVYSFLYNQTTLAQYPYRFKIFICHQLIQNSLQTTIKIINLDDQDMRFMIGGHPAFACPLYDDEKFEDYYLQFENKETVDAMQVVNGFIANVYKPCLKNENVIALKHTLFDPDAIILKGLTSKYVDLKSKKHPQFTRFYFSDFEILAIWSKLAEDTPFVCLEPWNGIQKNFVADHEKMGVLVLKEKETYQVSYKMEFHG